MPMRQAVAGEAAAAGGLSPTLFLLGQLSRENPGDSFGFLFREISRGPGTSRPAVRDAPRHCSASALRGEGTRRYSSAPRPFSAGSKPQGRAAREKLDTQEKKPKPLVMCFLLLTASPRRGFSLVPHTERQLFGKKNPVCSDCWGEKKPKPNPRW